MEIYIFQILLELFFFLDALKIKLDYCKNTL